MKYVLALTLALCAPAYAHSNFRGAPLPYSCEEVRWAFSTFSAEHLRQMGKKFGIKLTPAQMREAQLCVHGGVDGQR